MFGRLMSIPDSALAEYYLLLLDEDLDPDRHPGEAKRELARRLVDRFAGPGAGEAAEAAFDRVHVRHEMPAEVPEVEVELSANGEAHLPAVLAQAFGVSRSEARRLIEHGGVRVGGVRASPERLDVPASELDGAIVQIGRRRFRRLRLLGEGPG
jgi:tyrosyl-tRNA synthetase